MAFARILPKADAPGLDEGAPGYLTIDLSALARNYRRLSSLAGKAQVGGVVKADAYGLGAGEVTPVLYAAGCRHFFVAQFSEAMALRPQLPADAQLFVLNGLLPGNEETCADHDIIPVINSLEQWRRWVATAKSRSRVLPAVLQLDTGMSRLGVPPEERHALAAEVAAQAKVRVLFVMSHLASADEPDCAQNADQLNEMRRVAEEFPGFDVCFANSGGILLGADYHGKLVRPGIALYGGNPNTGAPNPMEPVVSLDVAVVQTRTLPAGAKVGYSGTFVTERETRLATIAAGYADGLPRSLSNRGAVYHGETRLPIVGRVSMDSITIDVTALPEGTLSLGSRVEVIGPHQSIDDLARDAGTISYEILTSLGRRYLRQYRR